MRWLITCTAIGLICITKTIGAQESIAPPPVEMPTDADRQYTVPPVVPSRPEDVADLDRLSPNLAAAYTLEEVLQLASSNNPTLRQAQLHISAELGKALEAGLYPNPVFSYEAEQIFIDVEGDKDSPGEFQGGVIEQRIVTAGKLRLSREKYLRRARVSEHQAMAQQFRVCNDVRIHFYRALASQQRLEIRQELLKTAEDAAVTAQESYNLGQARRPEVRQANVALQRARLATLSAENTYHEEFRRLTALVAVPLEVGQLEGELLPRCPVLPFEEAEGRLLAESPELGAARAKLAVDQATVTRERVEWVPDVVVRGGAGYNFEAKETTAVAAVLMEIPLYDRNQGTIQQARADYARQRQEIQRIELDLRNRLATTYQQYVTALQHAYEYERIILPELKAAYAELLQSYQDDRVRWPDVLTAQHDYFDARLEQVDNLLQARTQEVLVYGYLLHDGLMAAPGVTPPGHIDAVPKPR
jgi:outer membrane protein TolC